VVHLQRLDAQRAERVSGEPVFHRRTLCGFRVDGLHFVYLAQEIPQIERDDITAQSRGQFEQPAPDAFEILGAVRAGAIGGNLRVA
jgi:hypothetical protein